MFLIDYKTISDIITISHLFIKVEKITIIKKIVQLLQ